MGVGMGKVSRREIAPLVLLLGAAAAAALAASGSSGPRPEARVRRPAFDVGRAIEIVDHRMVERPGRLASEDPLYRAELGPAGLSVRLRGRSGAAFRIETARVRIGRDELAVAPGRWRAERNSATRRVVAV